MWSWWLGAVNGLSIHWACVEWWNCFKEEQSHDLSFLDVSLASLISASWKQWVTIQRNFLKRTGGSLETDSFTLEKVHIPAKQTNRRNDGRVTWRNSTHCGMESTRKTVIKIILVRGKVLEGKDSVFYFTSHWHPAACSVSEPMSTSSPTAQSTLSSTCALQCPQCHTTPADRRSLSASAAACFLHTAQPELAGSCRLTHGCNCIHTRGFSGLAVSPTVGNLVIPLFFFFFFLSSTSAQILGLC